MDFIFLLPCWRILIKGYAVYGIFKILVDLQEIP